MKKSLVISLLISMCILLISCSKGNGQVDSNEVSITKESLKRVDSTELQIRNDVYYEVNQKEAFDGIMVIYDEKGEIENEMTYSDGKLNGESIVYYPENGQIKYSINYKDGIYNGKYISYYENGQIRVDSNYNTGLKVGESFKYYENGQLKFEESYHNGQKDGKCIYYDKNGQIEKEEIYEDGEKVASD